MVVDTISDFLLSNNYTKKFIAIDFGLKHIGIARRDEYYPSFDSPI